QAEDGIRDRTVTGVQTCALPIFHDPPVFSLAGELYSGVFYQQLFRVLKRGGRLFHYIGNLNSKSSGTVIRGVLRRLQEAGFSRVVQRPEAFGVVAHK